MRHNELPFLPERMKIHKVDKLVPNLKDKRKYVVRIKALHSALHRVIRFKQSAWLKLYIMKNTDLRKAAKNEFEKNFFKFMNYLYRYRYLARLWRISESIRI